MLPRREGGRGRKGERGKGEWREGREGGWEGEGGSEGGRGREGVGEREGMEGGTEEQNKHAQPVKGARQHSSFYTSCPYTH